MILRDQFETFEITILTALKPETFMNISQTLFGVERRFVLGGKKRERCLRKPIQGALLLTL